MRRGLTLIETLAATVLLAALAAAAIPLLRETGRASRAGPDVDALRRLGRVADRVIAEPELLGLDGAWPAPGAAVTIHPGPWDEDAPPLDWTGGPVTVRRAEAPDAPAAGARTDQDDPTRLRFARLALTHQDWTVARWVRVEPPENDRGNRP